MAAEDVTAGPKLTAENQLRSTVFGKNNISLGEIFQQHKFMSVMFRLPDRGAFILFGKVGISSFKVKGTS